MSSSRTTAMSTTATTQSQHYQRINNVMPYPERSPPSLTHSPSVSSQASLPQPPTPPRGRLPSRYPTNLGRVPLHRRGTSNTYECLEDLLREAGYKETRIFTPEGEHDAEREHESGNGEKSDSKRSGVSAVVGFLAGLVPGATTRNSSLQRPLPSQENDRRSSGDQPPKQEDPPQVRVERVQAGLSEAHTQTPQSHRRWKRRTALGSSTASSFTVTSSTDSVHLMPPSPLLEPTTPSATSTARPQRHQQLIRPPLQYSPSAASLVSVLNAHANHTAIRPTMYFHHVASAPSIQRQVRQPGMLNDSDADTDDAPPLPRTWLENVACAVLFGGPGTHIGGPGTSSPSRASGQLARRHLRANLTRTRSRPVGLGRGYTTGNASDHALAAKSSLPSAPLLAPPPLCLRVQTARAGAIMGTVSRTAVVCRSAPASRSGSRVRDSVSTLGSALWGKAGLGPGLDADCQEQRVRGGTESKRQRGREWGRRRPKDDGVPSLARTRAEGDFWSRNPGPGDKTAGARGEEECEGDDEDGDEEDGHSSSEGELDLACMLVPPKRQHSIRSLRRHLHQPNAYRGRNRSGAATATWSDRENEDSDWWAGEGWHRKRGRRGSAYEDEDGYPIAGLWNAGEGSGGAGKRRRGIPSVWAQWAGMGS